MEEKDLSVPAKPVKLKRHFILAVIAITLLLIFVGSAIGELPVILLQKLFPNMSGGSAFLLQYLSFIGVDILVLAYCALFEKDIFRSFLHPRQGGSPGNTGKNFAFGLLIGFGMNALCILLARLHGDIHFYAGRFQLLYMLCALVCVCIQSGAEELVTRGYMMGALQKRYPVWVAIATNALLFGALHLTNPGITVLSFLNIVAIAVALSLVMYYFGSIWMCIAVHTAWNFTQNFLFGLPNSGIVSESSFLHLEAAKDSLFYDVVFGIEGTLSSVIVIAVFGAAVVYFGRKKGLPGRKIF
jgi:membrane protease YdiL (CAAX protease family)